MRKFDNNVQLIKYEVLREVSRLAMEGKLKEEYDSIPENIIPGPKPITRCCIYKERAIIEERVKLAIKEYSPSENIIQVLEIACDECPINRFTITEACRGCLAHRCSEACPKDAIFHSGQRAYINQEKCIECGKCRDACQFNAISDVLRPCRSSCPTQALTIGQNGRKATIDDDKCIQCGVCTLQCPFGAIMDRSFVLDVVDLLKESKNDKTNVYAIIAPAIASQFTDVKIGQVVSAIKKLGFTDVVEVALGADIVTINETKEFAETIAQRKVMTSSCCPAFVSYIEQKHPEFLDKVSTSVSPMIAVSRLIKKIDETAKVVFVGPCTAKKAEINREEFKGSTDYVLTFEELCALIDARNIKIEECEEAPLNNASYFGRIFARSGGLTEAIKHVLEKDNLKVYFKPITCDGIDECNKTLRIAKAGKLQGNFIEGMACKGGCIGGAASFHNGNKDRKEVDKYGELAIEKGIRDAIRVFDVNGLDLHVDRTSNRI